MGLVIATNTAAMAASRHLSTTDGALRTSLERLSSGLRINRAADDAAGLAIAEGLRSQVRGMTQAVRNSRDAINLAQTAEGALGTAASLLQRMRELLVGMANSGAMDLAATASSQSEVDQLKQELTRISETTSFNGVRLLDGTYSGVFQVGADAGTTVDLRIGSSVSAAGLGIGGLDVTRVRDPVVTATAAQARADVLRPGQVVFIGATVSEQSLRDLAGTVDLDGTQLDIGQVIAAAGAGDTAHLVAALNAAATALGMVPADPFTDDGDDLVFRGAAPTASASAQDLVDATPVYQPPSLPLPTPIVYTAGASISDGPRAGRLDFPGLTPVDIPRLGGTITANGVSFELGSVTYRDTDGDGVVGDDEALDQLNAAAQAAGLTADAHAFRFAGSLAVTPMSYAVGDAVLFFEGPEPAPTATATEVAAAGPVFTPAGDPLELVDAAIRSVSAQRADLGAVQNRLEHTIGSLTVAIGNAAAAESRIRDTDMAAETTRLSRSQIVLQAGAAMLSQANQSSRGVLALLG